MSPHPPDSALASLVSLAYAFPDWECVTSGAGEMHPHLSPVNAACASLLIFPLPPTLTSYSPSWCWRLPEIISYMDSLSPGGQVLVHSATVAFSELKIKPRTWQRELSIC